MRPSKLTIHAAYYGTGPENDVDVTGILRKHPHDALTTIPANNLFRVDPAEGALKRLRVRYSYENDAVLEIERPERRRFCLPQDFWLAGENRRLSEVLDTRSKLLDDATRKIALRDSKEDACRTFWKWIGAIEGNAIAAEALSAKLEAVWHMG